MNTPWTTSTAAAVFAALILLTTGCHVYQPYPPTPSTKAAQALQQLESLPSLEDTTTQVQAVMHEITSTASKIPDVQWTTPNPGSDDNCEAPHEQSDGMRSFLPDQVAPSVTLSESEWTTLFNTAKTAAAKLGATEEQTMQNGPTNHDVGFYGPTGLFIKLSYKGNLVVSGYTGCRLPQAKQQSK